MEQAAVAGKARCHGRSFSSALFFPPLFENVFLSRFLLFKMKDMHMFRSLKAHKQPGFILFSLFWVHASQFGLVKAARRVMFLLLLLLFLSEFRLYV